MPPAQWLRIGRLEKSGLHLPPRRCEAVRLCAVVALAANAQAARFVEAVGYNARPVQSVNHRLVLAPGGSQSNGH